MELEAGSWKAVDVLVDEMSEELGAFELRSIDVLLYFSSLRPIPFSTV